MRTSVVSISILTIVMVLAMAGCGHESTPTSPSETMQSDAGFTSDPGLLAAAIRSLSGWDDADLAIVNEGLILDAGRSVVTGDIVHYWWVITLGSGEFDQVRLHRVVREPQPLQPIHTARSLFLLHGDCGDFRSTYLPGSISSNFASDFGLAAFLAAGDVDVWGVDQAYTLVPAETEDLGFMASWGLKRLATELRVAMAVAQRVRGMTSDRLAPMNLLGFCGGVSVGYTALNLETQLPVGQRIINGYIQAEMSFSSVDEGWVEANCAWAAYCRDKLDLGIYHEDWFMALMADLARNDPDGESPIIPGFNNWQAALFAGGGPFWFADSHNHAAIWENDLPVDFQFLTIDQFLDINIVTAPYQPLLYKYEVVMIDCGTESLPFDDFVHLIDVPVLYLGAAGGFGPYCDHILSRIASDDIQRLDVQLLPPGQELLDIGHNDLFAGSNAPDLVWQPILDWVSNHQGTSESGPRDH